MGQAITGVTNLADLSSEYSLSLFSERRSPLITEALRTLNRDHERHGTKLVSSLVVWLVLGLTPRRDKNMDNIRLALAIVHIAKTIGVRRGHHPYLCSNGCPMAVIPPR